MTKSQIKANDGSNLVLREWHPADHPRAIIQLAHGVSEHLGRYHRLASRLASEGYAVIGADHRGHGQNASLHGLGNLGPRGFQGVVDDMLAVSERAKETWRQIPLVLLGHSFGSFAAQLFLVQHPAGLDGLVLSGTAAIELLLSDPNLSVSAQMLNAAFEPARTDFDWLSRDVAEVDAYIADPLCGHDLALESMMTMPAAVAGIRTHVGLRQVAHRQIPIYVISGAMDPIVGPDQALSRRVVEGYRSAGLNDVTHKIYADGRHEMFNEVNRERVVDDLVLWLAQRFG